MSHETSHDAHHHDEQTPAFGAQWWEQHYQRGDPDRAGQVSPHVRDLFGTEVPGAVLDVGCGTGADAIWLATQGWDVTAVDISPTAIERARIRAASTASDVAARISWVVADVLAWQAPRRYGAVVTQYVHPDAPFGEFVARLAEAVAPGGVLLVVGHDHADAHSTEHAPRESSIGTSVVTAALDRDAWIVETQRTGAREVGHGSGRLVLTDTVVAARRR